MTKHDTYNYLGVLAICVLVLIILQGLTTLTDRYADSYYAGKHGKTASFPQKPIKKVSK
jgi:hypothetical protein